ncbi:hypothetical protein [Streptomyces sp. NPDC002738]
MKPARSGPATVARAEAARHILDARVLAMVENATGTLTGRLTVMPVDRALRAMARATRPDAIVLVLTAVVTLTLDLVYAVVIGLKVTGALALRAVASQSRLDQVDFTADLPGG